MKELVIVDVSQSLLSQVKNSDKTDLYHATLLTDHIQDIEKLLGNCYYNKRGKVHSLTMNTITLAQDLCSGSLKATFNVNYSNGCQDLTYDVQESMTIDFFVDGENQTISFESEHQPERGQDEI